MSLSLPSLVSPARAQSGPPPGWSFEKMEMSGSGCDYPIPATTTASPAGFPEAPNTPLSVTYTPVFVWNGPPGSTATTLYVQVTASATAVMASQGVSLSDGYSDPVVLMASDGLPPDIYPGGSSQGTHLVQYSPPAGSGPGTESSLSPITLSVSTAPGFGFVSLTVAQDTRGLDLHRDGASDQVDANGTGHGDTVYSYTDTESTPLPPYGYPAEITFPVDNMQTFDPIYLGDWSQKTIYDGFGNPSTDYDVTGLWYPQNGSDTIHVGYLKMPYGSLNIQDGEWVGSPTGVAQGYITLTATDNQNPATATARYNLNVHDPWEIGKYFFASSSQFVYEYLYGAMVYDTTASNNGLPIQKTTPYPFSVTATGTLSAQISATAGVTLNLVKILTNINVSGSINLGATLSASMTEGGSDSIPYGWGAQPEILVYSNHYVFDLKHYGDGGLLGDYTQYLDTFPGNPAPGIGLQWSGLTKDLNMPPGSPTPDQLPPH